MMRVHGSRFRERFERRVVLLRVDLVIDQHQQRREMSRIERQRLREGGAGFLRVAGGERLSRPPPRVGTVGREFRRLLKGFGRELIVLLREGELAHRQSYVEKVRLPFGEFIEDRLEHRLRVGVLSEHHASDDDLIRGVGIAPARLFQQRRDLRL